MITTGQEDDAPIEELDLSVRPYGCLRHNGITHVSQIFKLSKAALMRIFKAKQAFYEELRTHLIQTGFMHQDFPTGPFADEGE